MAFKRSAASSFKPSQAKPIVASTPRTPAVPKTTPGLPSKGGKGNKRGH